MLASHLKDHLGVDAALSQQSYPRAFDAQFGGSPLQSGEFCLLISNGIALLFPPESACGDQFRNIGILPLVELAALNGNNYIFFHIKPH